MFVGIDDESLMGGKLQEQLTAGIEEQSEDIENEYGIQTSVSDVEHDLGIDDESAVEATVSDRYYYITFCLGFSYPKSVKIC